MHDYIVVVIIINQDRIQSYSGEGAGFQECSPTSVISLY